MLKVVGHRVMLEPVDIEKSTEWGFQLDVTDTWRREKQATQKGKIVGVGDTAWLGFDDGRPWAEVGDVVYFAKHSGKFVKHNGIEYYICNDEDIQAIEEEEGED